MNNADDYSSIFPYEVGFGKWEVHGYLKGSGDQRLRVLKSGLSSEEVCQAFIRVWLDRHVLETMF